MSANRKQRERARIQQADVTATSHDVTVGRPSPTAQPVENSQPQRLGERAPHSPTDSQSDEHDTRTLRALQALTDTALSHLSLEALLPQLLERVRTVMQVDNTAILLLDDATQELEVQAANGFEEEQIGAFRVRVGEGFAGRIAATRKPLAVDDLPGYPVKNPLLRQHLASALGVPLVASDHVLGVLHIGSATPRQFTADDEWLLTQAADRIALAVERAQLFAAAKAARAVAEQRAAFLSGTLEALGDGLVIVDAEGRLLYGNPAYSAMLGVAARRNTGAAELPEHVPSRMHSLDVRDAQGNPLGVEGLGVSRVLRGETLVGANATDVRIRRVDGREAYFSITGSPVRDATGAQIGAVMAIRDVTERRLLEEQGRQVRQEAQERAARLEAIFAAVADGLFVYDAMGRIVEQNPAARAMLASFAPPNTHDASVFERGHHIGGLRDTSGRELAEDEWPQARIARGETLNGSSSATVRIRRAAGSEAYLNVSGAPLRDETGAIVGSVCLYRDITDSWELGEALRQNVKELAATNVQLRTLLDVAPVGIAIVDATGKPLLVNDGVRQIWGQNLPMSKSAAEYGEYRAWRVDTGEPVAADQWGLARALSDGVTTSGMEYDIETFDGRRKSILDCAAPLRDDAGKITGAVSVIYDITERRQLEQRTRDALEAFIAITGALVDAPDDADEVSRLGATSPQTKSAEIAEPLHPTDAQDVRDAQRAQNESPLARRLAELTCGILGCSRVAVSEVYEVDGRLYDRPVAIVGMTPELERQWWAEQLALQPHEVGARMLPEDRERFFAGEVITVDLTRPPYQFPNDYGVTALLGAAMRIQGRMVGLLALDFEGTADEPHVFTPEEVQIAEAVARLGAIVLVRDRLLREREAARAEALALTAANRRMDEFLGIASHELRTPITTIKANLQLAQRRAQQALEAQAEALADQPDEVRARTLEKGPLGQLSMLLARAAQSAERQERLVEDLLDISRISAGRLEYRMQPVDLTALTRETVEEQRLSNHTRSIQLEEPAEPVWIAADDDRIRQAITNYLTNALKYSEGDRPVAVTLRVTGDMARIEVRDQGQGLSAEQQRHIFERFHRVPGIEVMSGTGVGLGLGLYITKTVIEQHGGQLGVESAPGVGSTFWFTIPLAPE